MGFLLGDFAACGRRVTFSAMRKSPMAQATFSCPFGAIHLEDRRGTAQDGHFVSIFAYPTPSVASRHLPLTGGVGPRSPITGGRISASPSKISGAQNLSGGLRFLPGHWALGLWKIGVGAVPGLRLSLRANAPGPFSAVGAAFGRPRARTARPYERTKVLPNTP